MNETTGSAYPLMTRQDVARVFRVDVKTVQRWAAAGKIPHTRREDIDAILQGGDRR